MRCIILLVIIFTQIWPTFVRISQALSTRPELCCPGYLEEQVDLQMRLIRYSWIPIQKYLTFTNACVLLVSCSGSFLLTYVVSNISIFGILTLLLLNFTSEFSMSKLKSMQLILYLTKNLSMK